MTHRRGGGGSGGGGARGLRVRARALVNPFNALFLSFKCTSYNLFCNVFCIIYFRSLSLSLSLSLFYLPLAEHPAGARWPQNVFSPTEYVFCPPECVLCHTEVVFLCPKECVLCPTGCVSDTQNVFSALAQEVGADGRHGGRRLMRVLTNVCPSSCCTSQYRVNIEFRV